MRPNCFGEHCFRWHRGAFQEFFRDSARRSTNGTWSSMECPINDVTFYAMPMCEQNGETKRVRERDRYIHIHTYTRERIHTHTHTFLVFAVHWRLLPPRSPFLARSLDSLALCSTFLRADTHAGWLTLLYDRWSWNREPWLSLTKRAVPFPRNWIDKNIRGSKDKPCKKILCMYVSPTIR